MQINGIVCFVLIPHSDTWLDYTPQWCGTSYRRQLKWGGGVTLEQCKQLCPGCAAIEYWSAELNGGDKVCWECLDHTKRTSYTNTHDSCYPPHVYIRQWTTPSTRTATKVAAEPLRAVKGGNKIINRNNISAFPNLRETLPVCRHDRFQPRSQGSLLRTLGTRLNRFNKFENGRNWK